MERASGAQLACISTVTGGQGPKARSHTSLGRSPRNQAESEARAESPIHKLAVQQSLEVGPHVDQEETLLKLEKDNERDPKYGHPACH